MSTDPNLPPAPGQASPGGQPPPSATNPPPVLGTPPLLPPTAAAAPWSLRRLMAIALSLFLGLFLVDGCLSVADDALKLLGSAAWLSPIRQLLSSGALLLGLGVYVLMGLTPLIPKRRFLLLALFGPACALLALPLLIYFYRWVPHLAIAASVFQLLCGLAVLHGCLGGWKFRWPLVPAGQLGAQAFTWRNLGVFLLVNLCVLAPAITVYLAVCLGLAVGHFTGGFLSLRPGGLSAQAREYTRADGKKIQLIPMIHIGDPGFYRQLSAAFPTNAMVLLEGVSDDLNLLTSRLSYEKLAAAVGLAEQAQEFKPGGAQQVRADVDISVFGPETLALLNQIMRIYAQGLNAATLLQLTQFEQTPGLEQRVFEDLLGKRNQHLLKEIQTRLAQSDHLIVPWGAAHMPELAAEIQKSGFRLESTQEHLVVRFHPLDHRRPAVGPGNTSEQPK